MSQIKFTSGTLQRLDEQYFNLVLLKDSNVVYKATITQSKASQLIFKSNNIQLIK
jgi:outer membrane protease